MNTAGMSVCASRRLPLRLLTPVVGGLLGAMIVQACGADAKGDEAARVSLDEAILVTQIPIDKDAKKTSAQDTLLPTLDADGASLLVVRPDGSTRVLCDGFHSAADAAVSFDASRILFAGKRTASDHWNIYETTPDGSEPRQITKGLGDCRSPAYHSSLYTMACSEPQRRIVFVGEGTQNANEHGASAATHLYSCNLDGSAVCRMTYNPSSDTDPLVMSDGRVIYASWQRRTLDYGILGRVSLFGVSVDGTDCALFASHEGRRIKRMPCVTTGGLLLFVESDRAPWDGAGCLGGVKIRRPLHSYRQITGEKDGLFHSPSPLPDGTVLVSSRPSDGSGTHAVMRYDPNGGKTELVFDDPSYHDLHARLIRPHKEPDGRSSVVDENVPNGKLYCLNVYTSDLPRSEWLTAKGAYRVRVLQGVPRRLGDAGISSVSRQRTTARRVLGEVDLEPDGSLNLEVPANTPIELQLLDASGMSLRSCGWIWAKNRESRGCIGCHEDPELTPENLFKDAFTRPSTALSPPPERRVVDFRHDIMPIIERKCVSCHGPDGAAPRLDDSADRKINWGKSIQPGRARTSPLVWHIFGRNTSRPWDGEACGGTVKPIPPGKSAPLTDDERRAIVHWIDMGAMRDGTAGADDTPAEELIRAGATK